MFIPPSSLGLHLRDQMGFGGYGDPRSLPRELSLCSTHTLLLQWGHSSNLNCNPGVTRSVGLLWQLFRSLTLKDGIQVFLYCCLPCRCPEKDLMPVVRTGSVLCLFCISHIWLFLDFLFQKVIPSFLQLQTVSQFPRWSFVPLLFTKETGEAMLANFFLTAYCSRPGPQFALCLWKEFHRPIEPSFEGSIPSKVVRWSGTTRTWRLSYVLWGHRALLIGKEIWYGLNTLTILSLSLPQSIGINPHCFQSRRRR